MTVLYVLIWLLLYPPAAALTTAIDVRAGLTYDDGGARALMWGRLTIYFVGTALLVTLHYV